MKPIANWYEARARHQKRVRTSPDPEEPQMKPVANWYSIYSPFSSPSRGAGQGKS
jgi:hypothetical protein